MDFRMILYVGLAGMLGSILRYLCAVLTLSRPLPTLICNLLGSLLIGFFIGLNRNGILSDNQKLILATGFCGGFTTFSALALENHSFILEGKTGLALAYSAISIIAGVGSVFLGLSLSKLVR